MTDGHDHRDRRLSLADDEEQARRLMVALLQEEDGLDEREPLNPDEIRSARPKFHLRASAIRALALLCVCSLSIGSH
jgi:hypothetical protein